MTALASGCGCIVDEDLKIAVVVNAAGKHYATAIQQERKHLKVMRETVTARKLIKAMQDEWKISGGQDAKHDGDDDDITNETALNATSTFHRDVKCYICGEKGHMENKCQTAGDGIKCYNCGERGHKSTEC